MDAVTRESRARIQGKYDKNLESSLRTWISQRTGQNVGHDFIDGLRNGVILCKLVNARKINNPGMAFKEMENLETFNKECRNLGLNDADLFVTNDLYNRANPTQVLQNLAALRTKLGGGGGGGKYSGTQHHVRTTSSNRVFDSKPAQVNLKGGSFGLRKNFEGKAHQRSTSTGGGWQASARAQPSASPSGGGRKFCGDCGSKANGKKFCGECGAKM